MGANYDLDEEQRQEIEEGLQELRDLNDPEADAAFGKAGVTQNEFIDDLQNLMSNITRMDNVEYSDEDFTAAEKSQIMGNLIIDVGMLLEKYKDIGDEDLNEVIQSLIDDSELETYIDTYHEAANDTDLSEYEQTIQELKTLYERTLHMGGLSDADKLERYDECLSALRNIGAAVAGRDDADAVMEDITIRIGMSDNIFPDKMIEYTALKADQIKELVERADNLTHADARDALVADGHENITPEAIQERFIEMRADMYRDADRMMSMFKESIFSDTDLKERIELLSGVDDEYLDRQREIVELEREQFEFEQQTVEEYLNDPANMTQEQLNQLGAAESPKNNDEQVAATTTFKPDGPMMG